MRIVTWMAALLLISTVFTSCSGKMDENSPREDLVVSQVTEKVPAAVAENDRSDKKTQPLGTADEKGKSARSIDAAEKKDSQGGNSNREDKKEKAVSTLLPKAAGNVQEKSRTLNKTQEDSPAGEKIREAKNTEIQKIANLAPDFTISDIQGNPVSLKDFIGQKVYINFWATFCGPCIEELPDIEEIHREKSPEGIVVLVVAAGQRTSQIQGFLKKKGYTFRALEDPEKIASNALSVNSLPTSVFIDKQGTVYKTHKGSMNKDEILQVIEAMN